MKIYKLPAAGQHLAVVLLLTATIFTSCASGKKINYFNDLPGGTTNLPPAAPEERVIQPGDKLSIKIDARDKEAANFFAKGSFTAIPSTPAAPSLPQASSEAPSYEVDRNGMIEMPVLGKLKVAKLTARELKDSLTEKVKTYLKDPIVDVSFTSFRITVLGEVRSPGTFSLDMQRTTLFEGLAAAGDLMHSARRHNVHLYRDYNGKRTITKLDLRQSSLLYDKSLFQLKPNDVLYVQARPGSIFQEDFGLIASIVSIVVSVVTLGVAVSK